MKDLQKLNSLLLAVLVLISSAVVYKWIKRKGILTEGPSVETRAQTTQENLGQVREDNVKPRPSQQVSQKEIDQQYEKVKYDRLIVAMRGHHTRDLERIVAEGLDFHLLPSDAQDKLQQVAQEEDFKSLLAPLFENK